MKRFALTLAVCCVLGACQKAEAPAETAPAAQAAGLHMDAPTQARMGVRTAPVKAASAVAEARGYARVLDVSPLAAIDADVGAAQAAAAASGADYRRLQSLAAQDQAASRKQVEAARAQAAADGARAQLAARRIGLEWGAGLERMGAAARTRLIGDVAAGRAALLRIDAPGAGGAIRRITVEATTPVPVTPIGPAASADARLQTVGVLGVARGPQAGTLAAGQMLPARVETSAMQAGYILPESALVRTDRSVWIYVQTGPDVFERRDVGAGRPVADGWFVTDGFTGAEQVVVDGAGSLLAAERGPAEAD